MFNRLSLSLVLLLFLGACSPGHSSQLNTTKIQLQHVVTKELQKTNRKFILFQKMKDKENVFLGKQHGENWVLRHKTKPFQIEKKGNKVVMNNNKNKEILSADQFGIISPLEHLSLLRDRENLIKKLPRTKINKKTVDHITLTVNEKTLARILKDRLTVSRSTDISPYLSGKVQVTYDLYYLPKTDELVKFETKISAKGDKEESCDLTYLF